MISQKNASGLRNPWLLSLLALIVLVLSVNGAFIWLATRDGKAALVDHEYKTRDRKSNAQVLSELATQQTLAWQTTIKRPKAIVLNRPAAYEIRIVDKDGKSVSGHLSVEAYRASNANRDFTTPFRETSAGNYQGEITFPLKGYWELRIHITRGTDNFSVDTERFMVTEAP